MFEYSKPLAELLNAAASPKWLLRRVKTTMYEVIKFNYLVNRNYIYPFENSK